MLTRVEKGQTLQDLAVQCYGSLEGIFRLMKWNRLTDMQHEFEGGEVLFFDHLPPPEASGALPKSKLTQDFYIANKLRVRTGGAFTPNPPPNPLGAFSNGFSNGFLI